MSNASGGDAAPPHLLWNGSEDGRATLVLAHGAGQPMDSPFMETVSTGLATRGIRVARFEFPYMAKRRITGRRLAPDRMPVLCETWSRVAEVIDAPILVVGGKSMGGRIASMIADEVDAAGLVCLGYPFHPPGKPEQLRTKHLIDLQTEALFCQGERDTFGTRTEVNGYSLSTQIRFSWAVDGDHSFKPRKKSGRTLKENLGEAITDIADFIASLCP